MALKDWNWNLTWRLILLTLSNYSSYQRIQLDWSTQVAGVSHSCRQNTDNSTSLRDFVEVRQLLIVSEHVIVYGMKIEYLWYFFCVRAESPMAQETHCSPSNSSWYNTVNDESLHSPWQIWLDSLEPVVLSPQLQTDHGLARLPWAGGSLSWSTVSKTEFKSQL